jgi:cytochrome c553
MIKTKGFHLFLLVFIFLFKFFSASSDSLSNKTSGHYTSYSLHDIRIGERLFYGLAPSATPGKNCAACHNLDFIDTLNWSPSAVDLANKYVSYNFLAFKKAITQPSGKVMTQIHDSLELSDEQFRQIKSYLDSLVTNGKEPTKHVFTKRIIFIFLIFLFLLTFVDFAITHKVKNKSIHVFVLVITALLITHYIVTSAMNVGRSKNYQPDQPVKFSHKIHAGQNKTTCVYCHFNAEQSKAAGIPPASVCMNCHIIVREGSRSGKFEINKIYQALDSNKTIHWIQVHNLPDHVFFSHAQHVVVGKIDCVKCHGDVANMDQIVQVNDLSMGWCVNCHRETKVQFDNKFYKTYEQLHKEVKEGKLTMVTAANIGGTDCMKCHY